jgi:hypothetical protein
MSGKIAADPATRLLSLPEAAERLVERWGVFLRREVDRLPPVSAYGPKGEPPFAVADLDRWAAGLPRRGRAANARTQPRGHEVSDGEARMVRSVSVSLFGAPFARMAAK